MTIYEEASDINRRYFYMFSEIALKYIVWSVTDEELITNPTISRIVIQ